MMYILNKLSLLTALLSLGINIQAQSAIEKNDGKWAMMVDEKPFEIKGATFGFYQDIANYDHYFADLQSLGVNSIRLWATNEHTAKLLDVAESYKIKVLVGIWMRHGRPGMEDDDSFNYLEDEKGKEAMYANAIKVVKQYKDHPAVLAWGVGNEVYLNTATDEEKKAYSLFLEKVCSEIKKLDANHPIVSVEAWTFGLDWWEKYVPSIDIYGLNCYGAGASILQDELDKRGINKPYIITEFGVTGEWDIQADKHGIKIAPDDEEKYKAITEGYANWIKPKPSCLGVYVFHYGNGNTFGARWLLSHVDSLYRPAYWAMRKAFSGKDPINHIPEIAQFGLPDTPFQSQSWVPVRLSVKDKEQDALEIRFSYNQRLGSRKRRDQVLPLEARGSLAEGFEIRLPKVDGPIKVYADVVDVYGNLGIAEASVLVLDEEEAKRPFLVPARKLPFYVYREGQNNPYLATAWMGGIDNMEVDTRFTGEAHAGNACLKITYKAIEGWYGLGLVDPANDWGDILGGYDLRGAKTFSFWAKTSEPGMTAKVGFGLIDKNKPFYDTAKKMMEIELRAEWKKYTIKLKKEDLSCIRSGLVIFSASNGYAFDIYLDEVVFE
jgi:hypothetical protein